ncbi:hypothetical protein [Prevotella sp. kh1p2]|nr:hypothetical protein [Prevotella sp. kh1p2]SES83583.1 hypothetical protein SAMN04487825_10579 [Prevotella sp. kh1p2]SNU10803.1 hypothetical protein SAMN06298210_10545 [Prevotellaceae bacterium KH2P17]
MLKNLFAAKKQTRVAASCGTACGTGDGGNQIAASCGTACGAGDGGTK